MAYISEKNMLRTNDNRVKEEYREMLYEESGITYINSERREFRLDLYYDEDTEIRYDTPHFRIVYTKEAWLQKFMERLEKALIIRYEDSADEAEFEGEILGFMSDTGYEESTATYTDKLKTMQIQIFLLNNQTRRLIVEFETRRDRTNFLNILLKADDVTLDASDAMGPPL